jgi:hypothetical protein
MSQEPFQLEILSVRQPQNWRQLIPSRKAPG